VLRPPSACWNGERVTMTLEELWPPFAVAVVCGPLTLRAMRDEDLPELAQAAADGIHADGHRPFPRAWASVPMPELGRDLANRYWKYRATFSPDEWVLPLIVRYEGRIVGVQGAEASNFPILRTPDTFSWLTQSAQGRGLGTLMRQAICTLLFDELDAHAITSGAYADNPASAAVSKKVGYAPNGTRLELRDDAAAEHRKFILTRDRFIRPAEPVRVHGGDALRAFAGVTRAEDPRAAGII
jgi:RimJ/RimL family protein N-acetyltransferase